ncbi:MAG: Ig-like domain-containing protein [Acidobacteria bacterium]|nr:Ig-like domain-containing protein [Acidobacteriota bacterium]
MNSLSLKKLSGNPKTRPYNKIVGLIGFIAILISVFTLQTNLKAFSQGPEKEDPILSDNLDIIPLDQIDREALDEMRAIGKEIRSNRLKSKANKAKGSNSIIEPEPTAIPAGIKLNRVTFVASDTSTNITAFADTNDDLTPEATEIFGKAADPQTDFFTSFTISKKTNTFYGGVNSIDGPLRGKSTILVFKDPSGTFKGNQIASFAGGAGSTTALSVINSPKGDILLAYTHFFSAGFLDGTDSDTVRLTAYLPNADGIADGSQMMNIPLPTLTSGATLNFTFGGMTTDNKGNVYLSIGRSDNGLLGFIIALRDTNGDLIPDAAVTFAAGSADDSNPITSTSLAIRPMAGGGNQLFTYSINNVFRNGVLQIAKYTDANGDLMADGPPVTYLAIPASFRQVLFDSDGGASGLESTHMDVGDGQVFFTFIAVTGNSITASGLATSKEKPDGTGDAPVKLLDAPREGQNGGFAIYSIVAGVPNNFPAGDSTPPMVKVNSPNGGEMVNGGSQLAISFTSSDDVGVTSHDINLSTDGGTTFPVVVASGLAGNVQTFNFPVPPAFDSQMARIRVVAKDAAGNMANDASDANFTIVKATTGDTMPPTVSITAPKSGDSLNGNSMATISFSATDNVGVMSVNIAFSADGNNFNTPLANGLPGSANSFNFRVPAISSTTAAIRVEAVDAAGNRGNSVVNQLKVVTDTTAPTVMVTSPSASTKKINGNTQFNVTFTSSDNVAVASHDIQIALDGTNFTTLASGLPGTATSAMVTIPNMKTKASIIRVIARDAAGNMGSGNSTPFKIKPKK